MHRGLEEGADNSERESGTFARRVQIAAGKVPTVRNKLRKSSQFPFRLEAISDSPNSSKRRDNKIAVS